MLSKRKEDITMHDDWVGGFPYVCSACCIVTKSVPGAEKHFSTNEKRSLEQLKDFIQERSYT